MAVANVPPPLRRRRVAGALRRLRLQADFTLDRAAEASGLDKSKISRTENASMGITGDVVLTLCEAYGVDKEVAWPLAELARHSRKTGWWRDRFTDINPALADLLELEADARNVQVFTIDLIPGLAMTEEYYVAYLRLTDPAIDRQELAVRAELRKERQVTANKSGTRIWAVIGEAALTHPVGGGEIMAAQLDHIVSLIEGRAITVQVLPLDLPGHAAMGVPFTLFDLHDGATFAFLDTLTGGLYLEEQDDIDAYQHAWTHLRANALDFHRSMSILKQRALDHRS
jgi:transcriptional regulator with XRE-family HTH domain